MTIRDSAGKNQLAAPRRRYHTIGPYLFPHLIPQLPRPRICRCI